MLAGQASLMHACSVLSHHEASCCTPSHPPVKGFLSNCCCCLWFLTHALFGESGAAVARAWWLLPWLGWGEPWPNLCANSGSARFMVKQGKGRRLLP